MAPSSDGKPLVLTCHHCALAHVVPNQVPKSKALCTRCAERLLPWWTKYRNNTWAMCLILAALAHYPFAMFLPILKVEELGLARDVNIVDGIRALYSAGRPFIGTAILMFSVVLPLGKIVGLYFLAARSKGIASQIHGKFFWLVELIGRWGMLDVFLVAIILAVVKIDMVQMSPGPGLAAFTVCVVLSLLSATVFDPESMWEDMR